MQNTVIEISEKKRRPLGVSIMAILLGIQGIPELIIAAFAIGGLVAIGHTLVVHEHTRTGTAIDILGWILGALPLIVGVITLMVAYAGTIVTSPVELVAPARRPLVETGYLRLEQLIRLNEAGLKQLQMYS